MKEQKVVEVHWKKLIGIVIGIIIGIMGVFLLLKPLM